MSEAEVREKIERARRARRGKLYLNEERITLNHGAGGKASSVLVEGLFAEALEMEALEDAARLGDDLVLTTDSYVVDPIFFPGGDIGSLAVHGTLNDLATSGAEPIALSLGVILEEGFSIQDLRRIVQSAAAACRSENVRVVTGDTKVVPRGKCDRIYLNTTGLGRIRHSHRLSLASARPGDAVLVSGPIGDHGITILVARGDLHLDLELASDSAPVTRLARALVEGLEEVHCLKDPTRGGVATSLNEIAAASDVAIALRESALPIRPQVAGACELLGIDPLHVACEGRLLAVVPGALEEKALAVMRSFDPQAAVVGEVQEKPAGTVFLRTRLGATRVLDMLAGSPLPRIC
ncbi:MAG: hydrogenase expression/formation protein HypE [Candidatus Xenobia bacterium]|jgi:hydrogenase expression/formation protein HypE